MTENQFGLVWFGFVQFGFDFDAAVHQRGLTKHTYPNWTQQDKKWLRTQQLKVNWFGLVWFSLVWFGF